jgi:NADPH:quinone reductase
MDRHARASGAPTQHRVDLGRTGSLPLHSMIGPPKSLSSFLVGGDMGADLATLVRLVAEGNLAVEIGWRGSWEWVAEGAETRVARRVNG